MDEYLEQIGCEPYDELRYCPSMDVTYQPNPKPFNYDYKYFKNYCDLADTPIGRKLLIDRTYLVKGYCSSVFDFGCGSGVFVKNFPGTAFGWDIIPEARANLKNRLHAFPEVLQDVQGVSMWDVLEHIPSPDKMLRLLHPGQLLFVTIPIVLGVTMIKQSKHYKPNEHIYYFSDLGIRRYLKSLQYKYIEWSDMEIKSGREQVRTYVFRKE